LTERPTTADEKNVAYRNNPKLPPGLILIEDFITEEEERRLLSSFSTTEDAWQVLSKRKVQHYGYEFDYLTRNANRAPGHGNVVSLDFPEWLNPVLAGMEGRVAFRPDQLTVNHYEAGQGIPHHIDTHSAFYVRTSRISHIH
jgi:alkylated DNA repair protein alkB family protein 8